MYWAFFYHIIKVPCRWNARVFQKLKILVHYTLKLHFWYQLKSILIKIEMFLYGALAWILFTALTKVNIIWKELYMWILMSYKFLKLPCYFRRLGRFNDTKKIICLIVFLDYGYRVILSFAFLAERRYHAVIVKKLHISQFHA